MKTVDSLRQAHKLHSIEHPDMSHCGGAVKGYYDGNKLVYIGSTYGAELGYSSENVYLKDTVPCKIIYREHFAEWDKHAKKYPHGDEHIDQHMTYTDTLYTIILSQPPVIVKSSGKLKMKPVMGTEKMAYLLECARIMRQELEAEHENKK